MLDNPLFAYNPNILVINLLYYTNNLVWEVCSL